MHYICQHAVRVSAPLKTKSLSLLMDSHGKENEKIERESERERDGDADGIGVEQSTR